MFKRLLTSLCLSVSLMASLPSQALQEDVPDETARLDTVIVVGNHHPIYGSAMSKFKAGDYAGADKEFRKIAIRIQSDRFNMESTIVNMPTQNRTAPRLAPGGQGGGATPTAAMLDQGSAYSGKASNAPKGANNYHLGDDDYGFSLYMAGLSQIQLGEYDKAKASFSRALVYSKTLDDAHFRIGLLELKDGRVNKAETKVRKLENLVQKCMPNCIDDAGNDLAANLALLKHGVELYHAGELQF